ncbi:MAG: DUF4397 domain-containing protein [Fimbriimonas sp.]
MLSLIGCAGGGSDSGSTPDVVTSLVVAAGQHLDVGQQRKLQFTARTSSGADVTSQLGGLTNWTSSNTDVLSFNHDTAIGVSNGTATARVSYTNQNGSVVTSNPVSVTVGTVDLNPVVRAFAAVPSTGPYTVTFTPTGGAARTIADNVAVGAFSSFSTITERAGKIRVLESGVQRSSRDITLEDNEKLSIVIAGTTTNTVIVPIVDDTTTVASGEFRLRFVLGYIASGQDFDGYILGPGQTVNDVAPVKTNRSAETGFVMDLPSGADRFAVTAPGSKTVLFSGTFDSPSRSDVTLVFDETSAGTYRYNFWGISPP